MINMQSIDYEHQEEILNKQTLWESRVLVKYNDKNNDKIERIRFLCAELIDFLEEDKQSRNEMDWEIARLYANAMTEIEWSCMWAIKAICK